MRFTELVNIDELQELCENYTSITGMATAILDLEGNILTATGWQDISTRFHRDNPMTAVRCRESDTLLAAGLKRGEKVNVYKCKNGLVDVAVPIKVREEHVANFFTGQFFLESPDKDFFIQQAAEFGFEKEAYLEALSNVPVLSPDMAKSTVAFFSHLGRLFGEMGLARKELEEANRGIRQEAKRSSESENRFRLLLDTIPDLIWLKDQEGVYLSCNEVFERLFGAKEADIIGKTDYDFVDQKLADFFRGHDRNAMNAGKPTSNEEWITFADDGQRALLYTTKIPLHAKDGTLIGVLGVGRDITTLRQAEIERTALENQLQQTHKMEAIGTLAGGIAHDFNNLLAIISGNIDIINNRNNLGDDNQENIQHIKNATSRAVNLVKQILSFSRQEAPVLVPVLLAGVIADANRLIRSTIPTTVEIMTTMAAEETTINADSTQLQQILINLCSNAVHAMDEKGLLRIDLKEVSPAELEVCKGAAKLEERYAKLSVGDTGSGMGQETIDRIFTPFFTTKEVGTGTGMGLSVVHGIVKQHGGLITVESHLGQGTTFNMYFPTIENAEKKTQPDIVKPFPVGTERILFVDDEEFIAYTIVELLECQGYKVTGVTSSVEALELFKKNPDEFDLVFTDQTMPEMSGVELATEILKTRPDIPIILCSGYSSTVSEQMAKGLGIREFCMKPMDMEKLTTITRKVLDEGGVST